MARAEVDLQPLQHLRWISLWQQLSAQLSTIPQSCCRDFTSVCRTYSTDTIDGGTIVY